MGNQSIFKHLRDAAPTISVGVLTGNLLTLGSEISLMESAGVHLIHVDVMDGCFCPPMTVGPPFIKAIKTSLLKDVHLMITEPLDKIADYAAAGADIITIHPESCRHVHRVLQALSTLTNVNDKNASIIRGVAINPGTPLQVLEPLLDEVELVLLLAVNPGWGGQQFIHSTITRIASVQQMIEDTGKDILLGVDGGITRDNVAAVAATGVDLIVTGSAVFDGKTPEANARSMLKTVATTTQHRKLRIQTS